jgi:hypothetical protein
MRTARYALGAATIALASFLVLSCNNSYGIFEDVQGQTKQNGSSFFQKTASINAFRLGAKYYASTSKLYARDVSSSTWSRVSIGGSNSYFLRSVVVVGSTIYALVGEDSSNVALYSSPDGASWSAIANIPSGKVLDTLFSANGRLYAVSHTFVPDASTDTGTSYYDLYYFNGSVFSAVNGFTSLTATIRGVVSDKTDGTGTNYWFASENQLYRAASPDNTTGSTGLSIPSSRTIWSLSYTGGYLYISTKEGDLYRGEFAEVEDVASVPLTVVIDVPAPSGSIILVGSDTDDVNTSADGYYEGTFGSLNDGSDNAIVAHSSSIYNSTVKNFPVHCFYYDPILSNLFICVSPGSSSKEYFGLYMSHWDGSSWDGWSAE